MRLKHGIHIKGYKRIIRKGAMIHRDNSKPTNLKCTYMKLSVYPRNFHISLHNPNFIPSDYASYNFDVAKLHP